MPSLIDLRRRIRSVKNTQQITKAMKMVSAAKLRRAQERAIAARPYATILQQMLSNVAEAAGQSDAGENPLLATRPENRILLVVVTADSGLAGGFNANLIRLAQRFADEHRGKEISFELIGKKGRDYFRRRGAKIYGDYIGLFRQVKYEDAEQIAESIIGVQFVCEAFAAHRSSEGGRYGRLYLRTTAG
jgi:F-type H+-transporting ATPase subunit gamma